MCKTIAIINSNKLTETQFLYGLGFVDISRFGKILCCSSNKPAINFAEKAELQVEKTPLMVCEYGRYSTLHQAKHLYKDSDYILVMSGKSMRWVGFNMRKILKENAQNKSYSIIEDDNLEVYDEFD